MKNRTSIAPWPPTLHPQPPPTETSHTISAGQVGECADSIGLCESWRGWQAGASSEFLNWFLFTTHGRSSNAEAAVLEDWICFKETQSKLDDRARAILADRLELLRTNPTMRIVIGGLSDWRGNVAQGMRLGLRRVSSIRDLLVAAGIDPGRIGIAIRGAGWSVVEEPGGVEDSTSQGSEYRLQITDRRWSLTRN